MYVLFCANRKVRKESQAFRLTEARLLQLNKIGSPLGFSMNKFIEPYGGFTSGTSRRNHAERKPTSEIHVWRRFSVARYVLFSLSASTSEANPFRPHELESDDTTAFFEPEFALRACEHFDVISNSHKTKQGIQLFAHWIADRRTRKRTFSLYKR